MDNGVALAIDVGGTKIAGGLIAQDGVVVWSLARKVATPDVVTDSDLSETIDIARQLAHGLGERDLTGVGLGVGVPEYVDGSGLVTSQEVIGWSKQPREELKQFAPGGRCTVESDVRCGALAESVVGAGRGMSSFFYVSLGTGLSSTMVIDGELWRGARGEAIALGEFRCDAGDGRSERLEDQVSGSALARRFAAARGAEPSGAHQVIESADAGDNHAIQIVHIAADALAMGLANVVAVMDPALIVLGGGLGQADGIFHERLFAIYRRAVGRREGPPPIVRAQTGAAAGLIGAGLIAWRTAVEIQ